MESTHTLFLFTSRDVLKKITSERSEGVNFLMHCNETWYNVFISYIL